MFSMPRYVPRRRGRAAALIFLALFCAAGALAASQQVTPVRQANADQVLRQGDVLFKLINDKSHATSWGIVITDAAVQQLNGKFNSAAARGDAAVVHVSIYVGNGRFAEARGGDIKKVVTRPIDDHAGYLFYVYRPTNRALGEHAAEVARIWANGRMKYKDPYHVPFRSSSYGPMARKDALRYGHDARRGGGPRNDDSMFCSEFIIAVYQAAMVEAQLKKNPKLSPSKLGMQHAMQLDASNTSPLVLNGKIREGIEKGEWASAGMIVVQP
jgi:hypothetical protein